MTEQTSNAWAQVAAFTSAIDADLDKWLNETYSLGLTEYRALTLLSQSPNKELRIAALARGVGLTSTSTTRLVSRLELKGHARRDVCEDDARGVYAVIDKAGEALLRKIRKAFDSRIQDLLTNPTKHSIHANPNVIASALKEISSLLS